MPKTEQKLVIINRLLASFPSAHSGTGDETLDGYLIGLNGLEPEYIAAAASRFLQGRVEGHNTAFAPSPAQLAKETNRLCSVDYKRNQHDRDIQKQLENRAPEYTESQMAERRAFVAEQIASIGFGRGDNETKPSFTDLPQAQAVADLDALALNKNKPESIQVSASLRKQYPQSKIHKQEDAA